VIMQPPAPRTQVNPGQALAPAELYNMENELIKEEIAVYREIAEEYREQSTNRLSAVMERDDLMRKLQRLNGERI
jgi:hypothetical protein